MKHRTIYSSDWPRLATRRGCIPAIPIIFAVATGCSAAQPACAIIDLADKACDTIVMKYVDEQGNERQVGVPKEELVRVGERTRLSREAASDAGSD